MDTKQKEELYNQFTPMLHKFSNKFSALYGINKDECLSIANLIFSESCNKYDSEKASFSTFLYRQLELGFLTHTARYKSDNVDISTIENNMQFIDKSFQSIENTFDSLNELSQKIVESVFNIDIFPLKVTKEKITNYFMKQGHSQGSIRRAFYDIKQVIEV